MALTKITSTNIQPGAIESSSLELSGAASGTYGAAAKIPVLSVNAQGIVYAISEVDVAGVTGFALDSDTEVLTISTADGNSFDADVTYFASKAYADQAEADAKAYTDTALTNLLDGAPAALDTLNELAAAINDDASYAATVTSSLATKVDKINITGATVGSASQVPVITFNAQGQITSATTTAVAGVSSTDYNISTGVLTINTSDGGSFTEDLGVGNTDAPIFDGADIINNLAVGGVISSTVTTGTAPLTVASSTKVTNLNADFLDGLDSVQFLRSDIDSDLTGNIRFYGGTQEQGWLMADGGIYVGTTTPNTYWDIRNQTGGDLFAIDRANGRVGIGTSAPNTGLDVKDGEIATEVFSFNSSVGFTPYHTVYIAAPRSGNLALFTDQTERVTVDELGNVGIGSATPNASLAIHRTDTNATFRVNREGVGASAIQLTADNLYTSIYSTKGSQPLLLGTANAEGIRIETDGKLWTKRGLHINGGDTLTNQYGIVISRNAATNQAGRIWTGDSALVFESIQDESNYGGFYFKIGVTAAQMTGSAGGAFVVANADDEYSFIAHPNGNATVYGTLTELSSIKVKENLEAITPKDSLEKVLQLKPYTYDRIDNGTKGESGLIAEDLEQVLPNLVKETDDGTKSVSYTKLVPYLIGAIQELQKEIEELKKNG